MAPKEVLNEDQEMFLERLWCLKELGKNNKRSLIGTQQTQAREELFRSFKEQHLLDDDEQEQVDFTPEGHAIAEDIIRRRRLTEVLLFNVLDLSLSTVETSACKIEHIINEEVTESICTFLAHPLQCPHGKPIPRGDCCRKQFDNVKPIIKPLKDLSIGARAKVVFITSEEKGVLQPLTNLGIYPGASIKLRQLKPTVILHVGETDVALDTTFTEKIFCRVLNGDPSAAVGENA